MSASGYGTISIGGNERVRIKEPRIKPLAGSEWNAEQQKLLNPLRATHLGGRVANINTTLANHPKLEERWLPFAGYILANQVSLPVSGKSLFCALVGFGVLNMNSDRIR